MGFSNYGDKSQTFVNNRLLSMSKATESGSRTGLFEESRARKTAREAQKWKKAWQGGTQNEIDYHCNISLKIMGMAFVVIVALRSLHQTQKQ